jgi:hypothetical protein
MGKSTVSYEMNELLGTYEWTRGRDGGSKVNAFEYHLILNSRAYRYA